MVIHLARSGEEDPPMKKKKYLDDYIEMLKEELATAEEYRKKLEETD